MRPIRLLPLLISLALAAHVAGQIYIHKEIKMAQTQGNASTGSKGSRPPQTNYTPSWGRTTLPRAARTPSEPDRPSWLQGLFNRDQPAYGGGYNPTASNPNAPKRPTVPTWLTPDWNPNAFQTPAQQQISPIPAGQTLAQWAAQNMQPMQGGVFNPSAPGQIRPTRGAPVGRPGQSLNQVVGPQPGGGTTFQPGGATGQLYNQATQYLEEATAEPYVPGWARDGATPPGGGSYAGQQDRDLRDYYAYLQAVMQPGEQQAAGDTGFGSRYKGWRRGSYGGGGGYGSSNPYIPPAYLNLFSWNYGE